MSPSTDTEINKLRWRCRRGSLELDLILIRYLDSCYELASPSEQQAFLDLLALEDTDLMRYLMGDERINRPVLSSLIDVIRALPAI